MALSSAFWFGYEITTFIIKNKFPYLVRLSIGIVLGMSIQALSFFISSLYYTLNYNHGFITSIIFFLISLIIHLINSKFSPSLKISYTILEYIIIIPSILFVMWGSIVCNIEEHHYTRGPSFADLPFHLNIISSFSHGINYNRTKIFDVWSCFQSGISLAYPMFHNFYISALIDCEDISLDYALQWTAVSLSFSFIILLHYTTFLFSNDHLIAILSIPTWIFLGGIGWTTIFYNTIEPDFVNNWISQFGVGMDAIWFQPLIHVFLPQRSAMFSLPLSLTCLICFMQITKDFNIGYFILSGLCTGFLPQLQVHSFVALAQFSICIFFFFYNTQKNKKKYIIYWGLYGLISCLIGIPLSYPFFKRSTESNEILKIQWLWDNEEYGPKYFPLITIWWKAIGPFAYIMLMMGWIWANNWQIKFWGASMFVWFTSSFLRYQPWALDNLKLLFAVWVPIAIPFVIQFYIKTWKKSKNNWIKIIILFLMIQNTWSSILCFLVELFRKLLFIRDVEYSCGNWISENTPINSTFLSYQSRFNPASSLAGRQLYQGFKMWMGQHGLQGPNREYKVNQLLSDKNNIQMYLNENVHYILLKDYSNFTFPLGVNNIAWYLTYLNGPYKIYQLFYNDFINNNLTNNLQILNLNDKKKKKKKSFNSM